MKTSQKYFPFNKDFFQFHFSAIISKAAKIKHKINSLLFKVKFKESLKEIVESCLKNNFTSENLGILKNTQASVTKAKVQKE